MDFQAEELLGDMEGEDREARRRLLERLAADGVSQDELREAVREDRLVLLPIERILGGTLSAREVQAQSDLPAEILLRLRRLQGLPAAEPDEPRFSPDDVAAARSIRLYREAGLGDEAIAGISRVLGESMARLSDTTQAYFVEAFLTPGMTEEELAMRFADLAERLTPALGPVLIASYTSHLRDSLRRGMLGQAEREAGAVQSAPETTVCFADLVGFTRLGWQLDPAELGGVAGRLAELAGEIAQPPVRLVKTIGDAAMFVCRGDSEPVVAVALSLLEAVEAEELPALRAGIACGPALQRGGDYYGHAVNVASRVTGEARPGSVLCTQAVRDASPDGFAWSFAGRHRLRGVAEPLALHRARRAPSAEDAEPEGALADRRAS